MPTLKLCQKTGELCESAEVEIIEGRGGRPIRVRLCALSGLSIDLTKDCPKGKKER